MKYTFLFIVLFSLLIFSACRGQGERVSSPEEHTSEERLVLIDTFWTIRGVYPLGVDEEVVHLLDMCGIDRDSVRVIRRDYTRDNHCYRVRWDWFVTSDSTALLGYTDYNVNETCL